MDWGWIVWLAVMGVMILLLGLVLIQGEELDGVSQALIGTGIIILGIAAIAFFETVSAAIGPMI